MSSGCRPAGNVVVVAGDEKVDVGLAVKSGRGPLCVPDYTKPAPSGTGWQYSQALATILSQYKVSVPFLFISFLSHPPLCVPDHTVPRRWASAGSTPRR